MKKTRDLEKTRSHILDIAFWEVYTRGFQGVSIDDIVKKTGMTKGAFYHHFPNKLSLGYALVEEVIQPMILDRWIKPLTAYKNPLQGILKQFQKHIGEASLESLQYGCPLNNLVQEMAPIDSGFKERLQTALNLWIEEIEKQLVRGQENGYLKEDFKPRQLAHFIVMTHEGFYGLLKGLESKQSFDSLYASMKNYFDFISAK
jgi:AcrR family transcriptional regulator